MQTLLGYKTNNKQTIKTASLWIVANRIQYDICKRQLNQTTLNETVLTAGKHCIVQRTTVTHQISYKYLLKISKIIFHIVKYS